MTIDYATARAAALEAVADVDREAQGLAPHPAVRDLYHERGWDTQPIKPTFEWPSGAEFVLDVPEQTPAVWGSDHDVAWPQGEALIVVGQVGTGKSTLAQQIALARIGIRPPTLLGLPVAPTTGRVLYLACDRPSQIRRSLRRMVTPADRAVLEARLMPWAGPLPFNLSTEPHRLLEMVQAASAHHPERGPVDTVIIDSLKDVALDLSSDETGARVALATQQLAAAGVELLILHHQRKASGDKRKLTSVDDVYGSKWITAAAGSVLLITGEPGDAYVGMRHLKVPDSDIGPLKLQHDHATGTTNLVDAVDLVELAASRGGISAADAARVLADNTTPDKNATERARRKLQALARRGLLIERPGNRGGTPATWHRLSPLEAPSPANHAVITPDLPL